MAITDISISEELMTDAPSIKYRGDEGPKSPEKEKQMMVDALLKEEYDKYIYDLLEQRPDATPMSFEEFKRMVIAEGMMSGGNPLPEDPTKPVNPFQPKPIGPVLPDKREMAAYGGIMGADGRKQYGIGSYFQKLKDKVVDDIIPNEIKDNPLATAAILAGGYDLTRGDNSIIRDVFGGFEIPESVRNAGTAAKEFIFDKRQIPNPKYDPNKPEGPNNSKTIEGGSIAGDIGRSLAKNIVPIVGGIGAGLFTKNTESDTPGLPSDNTALNLAEYKKAANLLNQQQGLAADMNFLPAVAARKFTPEEMAITYAQAANGGRIGFNIGGGADMGAPQMGEFQPFMKSNSGTNYVTTVMESLYQQNQNKYQSPDDPQLLQDALMVVQKSVAGTFANGGRINKAEGGIMDLGGMEKDYRAEGGFVPIGREEKADDVPARLSVNEFVFTADAVRNAGGGDIDEGAQVMENMMKHLEAGGQVSEESQGMAGARDMFETSERLSEVI